MGTNEIMNSEVNSGKVNIEDIDFAALVQNDRMYKSLLKSQKIAYITQLTRLISQMDSIKKIIECMEEPDYSIIYWGGNEKILNRIRELRHLVEVTSDYDKKEKYRDEIRKYEPGIDVKYAILIDVMLKTAEEMNLGLGINNSFPYFYNGCYWEIMMEEVAKEIMVLIAQNCGFN